MIKGAAVIGIDLDHTLIDYTGVLGRLAAASGLLSPAEAAGLSKGAIRALVRERSGGDEAWQRLQASLYSTAIMSARPYPGALAFLTRAAAAGLKLYIVSHKTEYAPLDPARTPLREVALHWLQEHRFFESTAAGLTPGRVFFEARRKDKIARIGELCCTHFIDDLPEFFAEPDFPPGVHRLLFDPHREAGPARPGAPALFHSWKEIEAYFFPYPR